MLRAPIWMQSAYFGDEMRALFVERFGDDRQARSRARASASSSSPFLPSPWKEYGELRGLNAPPRSAVAPASRTACAAATICSSDSTEQGPAMIDDVRAAERHARRDRDDRVLLLPFARHLLVRLADVDHLGDAVERLDARAVHAAVVADEADGRARLAGHRPRLVAHLLDRLRRRGRSAPASRDSASRPASLVLDLEVPPVVAERDGSGVARARRARECRRARPADRNASAPGASAAPRPRARRTAPA